MIHMVETGKSLPSLETLTWIARRTGKPLSHFTLGHEAGPPVVSSRDSKSEELDRLELLCAQRDFQAAIYLSRKLLEGPPLPQAEEATVHFYLGQALCRTYDHQGALAHLPLAREFFEHVADPWMVVECLDWEASAMFLAEEVGSLRVAEKALVMCQALKPLPPTTHARILGHLAWMHVDRHDWHHALRYCQASIAASSAVRDLLQLAKSYSDMGLAYQELGAPDKARAAMQKALNLYSLQADLSAVYRCENNLAELLIQEGDLEGAESHLQIALQGLEALNVSQRSKGYVLNNLGEIAFRRGDLSLARAKADQALAVANAGGETIVVGGSEILLARCAESEGRYAETALHWQVAISTFDRLQMPDRVRDCHLEFARMLKARGDLLAAANEWEIAAEMGKAISAGRARFFDDAAPVSMSRHATA